MARDRKLGRTTDHRMAMLKNLTTDLLVHERIETTESRAKEVRSIAENLIALGIKEKDNFETVEVKVVKAKLDSKGNKETEKVTSKNGKEYLRVVKEEKMEKRQNQEKKVEIFYMKRDKILFFAILGPLNLNTCEITFVVNFYGSFLAFCCF